MLFLAHLRGDPIGLSVGGLAVISKSLFLTVSTQITMMTANTVEFLK